MVFGRVDRDTGGLHSSSILVYVAANWWQRNAGSPWRAAIERGLLPVAVGLIFAGALAVARAAHTELIGFATKGVATVVLYFTRSSPYILIAVVAVLYAGLQMAGLPYT